jgi:hypothetical protein
MITMRFEQVTRKRTVRLKCKSCGKTRTRTVSVTHTVNPFNKNEDGSIRSTQEVWQCVGVELESEVKKLLADGIVCNSCEESSRKDDHASS